MPSLNHRATPRLYCWLSFGEARKVQALRLMADRQANRSLVASTSTGPKRKGNNWGVSSADRRGTGFEKWCDLSAGIASAVKNKRRLDRRDQALFDLWQFGVGCTGQGQRGRVCARPDPAGGAEVWGGERWACEEWPAASGLSGTRRNAEVSRKAPERSQTARVLVVGGFQLRMKQGGAESSKRTNPIFGRRRGPSGGERGALSPPFQLH
jgi:hypothetical protein